MAFRIDGGSFPRLTNAWRVSGRTTVAAQPAAAQLRYAPGAPGELSFTASSYSQLEGQILEFSVRRNGGARGTIAVDWEITGLAEGAPQNPRGTISWNESEAGTKTVAVLLGSVTADRTGLIVLSNPRSLSGTGDPTIVGGESRPLTVINVVQPSAFVEPSVRPLALIAPRQPGTAPAQIPGAPPFPSNHYSLFAYPGEPYYCYAYAKDGALPYRYFLRNAPEGMTIDERTGLIVWPNPQGTSVTPTVGVEDAEGTVCEEPFTITITTQGFAFLDAVNGSDSNSGSRSSPWRTLPRLYAAGGAIRQAYFSDGIYPVAGLPLGSSTFGTGVVNNAGTPGTTEWWADGATNLFGQTVIFATGPNAGHGALIEGGAVEGSRYHVTRQHSAFPFPPQNGDVFGWGNTWRRTEWTAGSRCVQWIARFGHQPVIDHGHTGFDTQWGAMQRLTGNGSTPVTVIGFRSINWLDKAWQVGTVVGHYYTFANLRSGADGSAVAVDGSNPGLIMMLTGRGDHTWLPLYRDILCENSPTAALKLYSINHAVIEKVDSVDIDGGSWDVKDDVANFDIRFCRHIRARTARYGGLYGNFAAQSGGTFRFCLADTRGNPTGDWNEPIAAEYVQQGSPHGRETWYIRCTLIGRVWAHDIDNSNGPLHFRRNVIINDDASYPGRVFTENVASGRVLVENNNLVGSLDDNIVDAEGRLQGTYRDQHGPTTGDPRGHELA